MTIRARRLAPPQRFELLEVHRLSALRDQIRVDEQLVSPLIVCVVRDVLRHVGIEVLQRLDVGRVPSLRTSELGVLLPEVGLEQLGGGEEPQDCDITRCRPGRLRVGGGGGQGARRYRSGAGDPDLLQE